MQASYSKISQKIDQICSKNKTKLRKVLTARTEICRYISHKTPYCPLLLLVLYASREAEPFLTELALKLSEKKLIKYSFDRSSFAKRKTVSF